MIHRTVLPRAIVPALLSLALLAPAAAWAQPRASLARTGLTPASHRVRMEGEASLHAFHDALRALERDPSRQVRVLHYGDSNVAADLWTQVSRDALQARFGDGGSGYILPRGYGSWHRVPATVEAIGPWQVRRRGNRSGPNDGRWGLGGVAMEPIGPGARLVVRVPAPADDRVFELHLLGRPMPGGVVSVTVDGGEATRISTRRQEVGPIVHRLTLSAGTDHHVVVRHVGGRPRVLGIAVDGRRGVVYDVLGINGARAGALAHWDRALWRAQLRERRPDLVVMSYGGNEALDPNLSMAAYEEQTRLALDAVRHLTPEASCLLVGPVASMEVYSARMGTVAEVQRRLAAEFGCAFWDSAQTTGGPGTLRRWTRYPGMVAGDRLHLGPAGYALVGREFVTALLHGI